MPTRNRAENSLETCAQERSFCHRISRSLCYVPHLQGGNTGDLRTKGKPKEKYQKTKQEMAQDIGEYPRGVPNVNVRAVSVKCDNPAQGCYSKQSCPGTQFKEQRVSQRYTKRNSTCSLVASAHLQL